eukprot:TRINITY_DN25868_c0_g1_i2.p1 TRINITY_DN25868_c0_g1~~TRINITY_DN25868_c0_g1_i2.p1  ORF type:complete len:1311 (+),score=385.86 TRINITY_DN25868_c0_g1_i2:40-3972(+)
MVAMGAPGDAPQPPRGPPPASLRQKAVKKEEPADSTSSAPVADSDRQAKIRALAQRIRSENRNAREAAAAAEKEAENQAAQEAAQQSMKQADEEMRKLEALLPGLEEKVVGLEDEAERVAILAAPLTMEAIADLKDLQLSAIRDTERALKAAKINADSASRELERCRRDAEAPPAAPKALILAEIKKLQERCEAATAKLDEHKNVRKDHELAIQAEKMFAELAGRLASVEVDCEKAAMMAEPIAKALQNSDEELSPEDLRETRETLRIAQAKLAPTLRLVAGKVSALKGPMRAKMEELQARAEGAQGILDKAHQTIEEAQGRAAALPILKQVSERLTQLDEVLEKMRETEAPFLMGIENLPSEESGEALQKMEKAATLAMSAHADANKYVGMKLVEVGRLAESAAEDARRELQKAKQQIEMNAERVRKFQADTLKRKRQHLVHSIHESVEAAVASITKLQAVSGELQKAEPESLTETIERAQAAELEAQGLVTTARRAVQEKQQEMRPLEAGSSQSAAVKGNSEVLRSKVKVNQMEGELQKFRKVMNEVNEKIKVQKSMHDVSSEIMEADLEIARLTELSQHWPAEQRPPPDDEKAVTAVQDKLTPVISQVEQKLKSAKGLELKELRSVFGRLQNSQKTLDAIKTTLKERTRSAALSVVNEAAAVMKNAEQKLNEIAGAVAKPGQQPLESIPGILKEAKAAAVLVSEAQELIAAGTASQLPLEAKVEFARLQLRVKAADRKAKTSVSSISAFHNRVLAESRSAVLDVLQAAAKRGEGGAYAPDALFDELSEGGEDVAESQLTRFFDAYGMGEKLSEDKVQLAMKLLAPRPLSRQKFCALLADYYKVDREVSITDEFGIQASKKVRKLTPGELLLAKGGKQKDETLGLERMMCCAVVDGASGWVTVKTKAGMSYLSSAKKPYLWCSADLELRPRADSDEGIVRKLRAGECLELLEGPRKESLGSEQRLRGVACNGETSGWLQVQNASGETLAKEGKDVYKCIEAIAMTDIPSFDNCTMLRRVDVGEALELVGTEEAPPGTGGTRRKFRACKDGVEGWVTVKGSQGTLYLKPAKRHYICIQACPLHAALGAESPVQRVLMPGEAFLAFEEPKEVSGGQSRCIYKVRAVKDGAEGFAVATAAKEVQPWSSTYKVLKSVPLTKSLPANEAAELVEVLRTLQHDELVEASEVPIEDVTSGQFRIHCKTKSDAITGWATICESEFSTEQLLRPASEEEIAAAAEQRAGSAAPTTPPRGSAGKGKGKAAPSGGKGGKRKLEVKEEVQEEPHPWHRGTKRAQEAAQQFVSKRYKQGQR